MEKRPGKISVTVCTGTNCAFRGATQLLEALNADREIAANCTIVQSTCIAERCDHSRKSPVVTIEDRVLLRAQPESVLDELYSLIERNRET